MSDYLMGQEAFEDQLGGYLSDSKNRLGKLRDLMQRVKGGKNTKLSHNIQESINSEIKFQQVIEQRIAPVLINEGYSEDDWKGIMEKIEQIITKAQDTYNQIMTNFPTLNRISLSAQTKASKAQIRMNSIDEIMYSIFGEKSLSKGMNQKSDFQKKIISKAKKSQLGTRDLVFKIKELTELKKRAKTPEGKDLLSQAIQALTQYKTEIYNTAYTRVKIGGTYKRVPKESSNKNEQKRIDEALRLFKKDLTIIGDNIQQNFKENEQIIRKAQQNAQKIHEQPNIDVFGKLQNIGQIGKKMPTRQFKPETKSGSARFTTVPSDTSVLKLLPGQFRSVRTKSADHFLGTDYEFLDPQVVQELQELKQQGKSVSQISHSAISKKFLPTSAYFEAQNKNTQKMISAARDALKTATASNKNIKAAENQLLSALTSSSASYGTGMHKLSEEFNRQALDSNYVGSIDFSDLNKLISEMASNPLEWLRKHGGIDNPLAGLFTKSQTGQWILREKAIKDIPALIKWLANRDVRQVEQGTGGIYRTRSGQYVSLMGQSDIVVETEPNKLTYVDTKFRKESVRTFEEFTQALAGVIGLNSQLEALGTQERVTRVAFAHMAPGSGKVTEQIHDISDMQVQDFSQILDIIGDLQAGKIDTAQAIASLPPTVQEMFIKQLGGVLGKSGRKMLQEQGMYFLESEDASEKNMVVTKQMIKFGKYNPNISSSRIDEAVKLIRSQQKEQWNDEGFIKNIGKQLGTPGQGIIDALKEGNADKVEAEIQKYLEQVESNTTQVISYPQFYDPETKTTFTMSKIAGQWESAKTEEDKRAILRKFTNVINSIPQMEKRRLQAYSIRAKARKIVGEEDTSENARNIRFAKALMKEGNLSFNFRNINKIEEMISGKTTEDLISSDLDKQILDELGPEGEQIAKAVKTGDVKKIQDAIIDYKNTFLDSSQQKYKPFIRQSQISDIINDLVTFASADRSFVHNKGRMFLYENMPAIIDIQNLLPEEFQDDINNLKVFAESRKAGGRWDEIQTRKLMAYSNGLLRTIKTIQFIRDITTETPVEYWANDEVVDKIQSGLNLSTEDREALAQKRIDDIKHLIRRVPEEKRDSERFLSTIRWITGSSGDEIAEALRSHSFRALERALDNYKNKLMLGWEGSKIITALKNGNIEELNEAIGEYTTNIIPRKYGIDQETTNPFKIFWDMLERTVSRMEFVRPVIPGLGEAITSQDEEKLHKSFDYSLKMWTDPFNFVKEKLPSDHPNFDLVQDRIKRIMDDIPTSVEVETRFNKDSADKFISLFYRVPQIQKKIEESLPKDKTWTAENINWKSIQEALDLAYGSGIEFSNWDLSTIVEKRQVEELSKALPSLYQDLEHYSDIDQVGSLEFLRSLGLTSEDLPPELLQYLEEYIIPFGLWSESGWGQAKGSQDNRPISIPEQTDVSSDLSAKKIKALFATTGIFKLSNKMFKDAIDLWTSENVDDATRSTAFFDIFGDLYGLKSKGFESINAADLSEDANKALVDSVKIFKERIESLPGITNTQKRRVLGRLYRMAGMDSIGFDTPENLARAMFRMITAPQDVFQYMEKLSPEQVGTTEWTNKLIENINTLDTSFKNKSSLEVILKALDMDSSLMPEEGREGAEAFQSKYGTNALNIVRRLIIMKDYLGRLKETDPEYKEIINSFGQIFQDAMSKREKGYDFWQEYTDRGGTSLSKYLAETGFGPLDVIRGDNEFWQVKTKGKGKYNLSMINPSPATRLPQTPKSRSRYNKQTGEEGQTPTAFGLLAKGKYDDSKQSYYYKVNVPEYGYPLIYSSNQLLNPNTNVEVPLGDKETVGTIIGSATPDDLKAVRGKNPQLKIKPISKVVGTGISSVGAGSPGTVGGVSGGNMGNFQANTINITANNVNVTGTNVLQNGTSTGITWLPSNTSTVVNSGASQGATSQNTQNSGFTNSARNVRQLNALLKEKLKIEKEILDLQKQQQKFAQGTSGYEATRKYLNINKKKVSALKKEVGLMLLGSTPQISDDMFKQINSEYKLQLKEYKLKSDIKSATPLAKDVSEFEKLLRQRTRQQYELLKTQKRYNTINPFSGEIPFLAEQMIFGQQNLEDLDVRIQRMVQSGTIPQDVAQSITARFAKDEEKNKLLVGGMKGGSGNIFEAIGEQMKQLLFNFTQFGAAYKVIGLLRTSINNVIKSAQQLDKVMTDLRIVTGGTKEETSNLMSSYAQLGGELAATTTEVANAANSWLRQGYSINETNELISASLHLSKLGMIESGQATEYLMKVTYIYN